VVRPALSASRSLDIIDFLAAFPGRGFSLSEIVRATDINVASCHAVLNALVDRGYLFRCPKQKTFSLGPVLVAVGDAALQAQPLIASARQAAHELRQELGTSILLSTAIGEEIVGIVSLSDATGRWPGLRTGERRPLVPPIGAAFLAWAEEQQVEAWLSRAPTDKGDAFVEEQRHNLALIRKRGFQVTLRSPDSPRLAREISAMATGRQASEYKSQMIDLVHSLGSNIPMPEVIEPEALYDVILIAAPIFDQNGACMYNLCLGDFHEMLTGATVLAHADRLVRACLQIMHADRAQQRA
jgi:DNA-binding IclR family transcriptional regulator